MGRKMNFTRKLKLFQVLLHRFFPSWDSIMKHQEVLKFACGLADDAEEILEFIYQELIKYLVECVQLPDHLLERETTFLGSLLKEVSREVNIDPLHNKYVNFVTVSDARVFIPSQVYIFGPGVSSPKIINGSTIGPLPEENILAGECLVKLEEEDGYEILKVLEHIKQYQEVSICNLDWKRVEFKDDDDLLSLAKSNLNISRNITSIRTWECSLASTVYQHIVTQLQHCNNLQRLDLSESKSEDIASAVAASKSLVDFHLYNCEITPEAYSEVARELIKHVGLQRLHLNKSKGVPPIMGIALAGMKSLKEFYAQECRMSRATSRELLGGLANCRELEGLHLARNLLTGCMELMFPPNDESGFPVLERLRLNGTWLNESDVRVLSDALRSKKLPNLKHLDISYNYLTGIVNGLLGGRNDPGFPSLVNLSLNHTFLSKEDLQSITEAVGHDRIPQLQKLDLNKNDFSSMRNEMQNLVEICVKIYDKLDVNIHVFQTKFTPSGDGIEELIYSRLNSREEFLGELRDICNGSVVTVKDSLK